jgi:hypothetical protein
MKRVVKPDGGKASKPAKTTERSASRGTIHPIIIYPFTQPSDHDDLKALYGMVERLGADRRKYARPITVMDRKTYYSQGRAAMFQVFRDRVVGQHGDILDAWCVDTCQMWYAGLGAAYERGRPGDVYWLIPGDFNYGTAAGREVLGRLHDLPEIILELEQDICIGEIATDHSNSKQLIDTHGTFALLYNWFPSEAQAIRQYTERPRSEFFALRHEFLGEVLAQRWYPYEQTVVMLLQAVARERRISRFFVGNISDLPEGRESLSSALQQVERTERVLKSVWRERHQSRPSWIHRYRELEANSEQIRQTAVTILQNLLPGQ